MILQYPPDCRPQSVEPLGGGGGFSGARLWRVTAARGTLCLRRFPQEHPDRERLKWIQSVVAHVAGRGFRLLPSAIRTIAGQGLCEADGHLWELTPWMPGVADYWTEPRPEKLRAAMTELARFHLAAATFASLNARQTFLSAEPGSQECQPHGRSPGVADRLALVECLLAGGVNELRTAAEQDRLAMPALADQAVTLFKYIAPLLPALRVSLIEASSIDAPLQPCLRDIWHDHVLFQGDRVSGIVDVGSMKTESVAADDARLLSSFCGNDYGAWSVGEAAYQAIRPLSETEQLLVRVFDQSQMLLAGVKWVQWVFMERRTFADPPAVVKRMEQILSRLGAQFGVR